MSGLAQHTNVVPACLSFLSIYNPTLGRSEDNLEDQIVYYYSKSTGRIHEDNLRVSGQKTQDGQDKNERLRQTGLAQGMVEFAKSFSGGESVDTIETEKSRIILHELEKDWWIVASVDLTRLFSFLDGSSSASSEPTTEFSAREVSPPALLLQHLLRAHHIFLLHNASSLSELFARTPRTKFCSTLKRFWSDFVWGWDVLLNGNPAVEIFNGIKLAAGGELGIGVGEEDWGSGEREVLEGFIGRTEGLVDLVVSRFGEPPVEDKKSDSTMNVESTKVEQQATGRLPGPSDGVLFSGISAISRVSIKAISHWAESLYIRGEDAYGVRTNPNSTHRRKQRDISSKSKGPQVEHRAEGTRDRRQGMQYQNSVVTQSNSKVSGQGSESANIPPSIIRPRRTESQSTVKNQPLKIENQTAQKYVLKDNTDESQTGTETMIKYLTLGVYGSKWGIPFPRSSEPQKTPNNDIEKATDQNSHGKRELKAIISRQPSKSLGHFLIGFQGDLEGETDEEASATENDLEPEDRPESHSDNSRTMVRTLYVDRTKAQKSAPNSNLDDDCSSIKSYTDRLRVLVYIRQPFMFIFLFELQTDVLAMPAFYRSIHHQLGPLQRPLLISTSPQKVNERLSDASVPKSTATTKSSQPICDLVYDPTRLTVHTTIPNIPDTNAFVAEGLENPDLSWNRIEALNVHSQILNTHASTRRRASELERTCKTSRGWWVVWMRLPHATEPQNTSLYREAFLIRKASDYNSSAASQKASRFGRDVKEAGTNSSWGPGKLAEGIGIDARQYIEGLLSLNR